MFYSVTLTKDDNGSVLVRFPGVPEAITYGDTEEEALEHAVDALLTAFDVYMKDKRDIPAPSATKKGLGVEVPALDASKIALYQSMRERRITKSELGRRLNWHLPQVDRVLQVRHGSRLDQLEAAFSAIGKRLEITVTDREPAVHGAVVTPAKARTPETRRIGRRSIARRTAKRR